MGLMLVVGIAWMALAISVAVLIGRAIRVADARSVESVQHPSASDRDAQVLSLQLGRPRTLA